MKFSEPSARSGQTASLILGLLMEEAIAEDPQHAGIYGRLQWKESENLASALEAGDDILLFQADKLASAFLTDSKGLLHQYRTLCQELCIRENQKGIPGRFYFSGAGNGVQTSSEQAAPAPSDTVDYRSLLERFCVPREEAILDPDSFDYIPYLYGLKENILQYEPLEYCEVNRLDELAIAIDTSGSCSGDLVRRFLGETWAILHQKENFFSRMRVHLIQCDSLIQDYRVLTSAEQWEELLPGYQVRGHGDTDFTPVFDLLTDLIAKKEIRSLRALLYFTDGDGICPRKAPPFETVFVFVSQASEKGKVPGWAHRVNLQEPAGSRPICSPVR